MTESPTHRYHKLIHLIHLHMLYMQASFEKTRETLLPRTWAIDNLDTIIDRLTSHRYRKAVLFVDNAGSDVILGESFFQS